MSKIKSGKWWLSVLERAVKTFAEMAISMLTVGQAFVEVDWIHVVSVSGVAAITSVLISIATLPEVEQ